MKKVHVIIFLSIAVTSCGSFLKVSELNNNGRFKANKMAKTLKSVPFDLDAHKALLVVPNEAFFIGMTKNINYFNRVISIQDLEQEIQKAGKLDALSSLRDMDRLHKAYEIYQPFLYLGGAIRDDYNLYLQFELINPSSKEKLYVNEILYDIDRVLRMTDKNTFNPLFNGVIEYIESNSKTYNK